MSRKTDAVVARTIGIDFPRMRSGAADIHDGQEQNRSIQGPDTEARDQTPPFVTSGLQHTAGPYSWVINRRAASTQARQLLPQHRTWRRTVGVAVEGH